MRIRRCLPIIAWLCLATAVLSAQRTNSADEFKAAMRTIDAAMRAASRAIDVGDYTGAKAPLVLARQTLTASAPFWSQLKIEAGTKLSRETVRAMDALDTGLSHTTDASQIKRALSSVSTSCAACHTALRESNGKGGYRIKASALPAR